MDSHDQEIPTGLERTRAQAIVGLDGRALRRANEKGKKNRLMRGVYVPTGRWNAAEFVSAVVSLDAGLKSKYRLPNGQTDRTIRKEELVEALERLGPVRGCRGAKAAAGFADGDSGSVGESASRANIFLAGLPAPRLQVAYPRPNGGQDLVDFTWEAEHHVRRMPLLSEFDERRGGRRRRSGAMPRHPVVWAGCLRAGFPASATAHAQPSCCRDSAAV